MKEIKRYREMDMIISNMREYDNGEWVRDIDHKALLETMQERIEELEAGIQGNIDRAKRYKDHKKKPNQCVDLIHYELTKLIINKV